MRTSLFGHKCEAPGLAWRFFRYCREKLQDYYIGVLSDMKDFSPVQGQACLSQNYQFLLLHLFGRSGAFRLPCCVRGDRQSPLIGPMSETFDNRNGNRNHEQDMQGADHGAQEIQLHEHLKCILYIC